MSWFSLGGKRESVGDVVGNFLRGKLRSLRVDRSEEEEDKPVNDSDEGYPESFLHVTGGGPEH